MDSLFPIIALVVYFLLTGMARKKSQQRRAEQAARDRSTARPTAGAGPAAAPRSGINSEPLLVTNTPASQNPATKRTQMPGLNSLFSTMLEKLDQAGESASHKNQPRISAAEDQDWEPVADDELEAGADTTEFAEQQSPIDSARASDAIIQEGVTVFDKSLSEMNISAYDTKKDSYAIRKFSRTAVNQLEARLEGHTFFERGIIYAEILGKPVSLKAEESW